MRTFLEVSNFLLLAAGIDVFTMLQLFIRKNSLFNLLNHPKRISDNHAISSKYLENIHFLLNISGQIRVTLYPC